MGRDGEGLRGVSECWRVPSHGDGARFSPQSSMSSASVAMLLSALESGSSVGVSMGAGGCVGERIGGKRWMGVLGGVLGDVPFAWVQVLVDAPMDAVGGTLVGVPKGASVGAGCINGGRCVGGCVLAGASLVGVSEGVRVDTLVEGVLAGGGCAGAG